MLKVSLIQLSLIRPSLNIRPSPSLIRPSLILHSLIRNLTYPEPYSTITYPVITYLAITYPVITYPIITYPTFKSDHHLPSHSDYPTIILNIITSKNVLLKLPDDYNTAYYSIWHWWQSNWHLVPNCKADLAIVQLIISSRTLYKNCMASHI